MATDKRVEKQPKEPNSTPSPEKDDSRKPARDVLQEVLLEKGIAIQILPTVRPPTPLPNGQILLEASELNVYYVKPE